MKISISFLQILGILFIALRLTGHIDWSWWWVLSPLWAPFAGGFIYVGGEYLYREVVYWLFYNKGKI